MSLTSRRELLSVSSKRYRQSSADERKIILDEFVRATGYNRNYAIRLLLHPPTLPHAKRGRRPRRKSYGHAVQEQLERLWRIAGGVCGKRLAPLLPDLIVSLERSGEISLDANVRERLMSISAATCDRLLVKARSQHPARGLSLTRPSPNLEIRSQVPVRTFADWSPEETRTPGHIEIDLVAHCGDTAKGRFLHTLTATDLSTGWTACQCILNKSQISVECGLDAIAKRLPFAIVGVHCDNGSEFINHNMRRYCDAHGIAMTRSRPYKKNDQCRVEQKNGNVVRAVAGYWRYETPEAMTVLNAIYNVLDSYQNYFQPSAKRIRTERDPSSGKAPKRYDTPATPYRRLVKLRGEDNPADLAELLQHFEGLNPAALNRSLMQARRLLRRHAADLKPDTDRAVTALAELSGLSPTGCSDPHPYALAEHTAKTQTLA